VAGEQGDVWQIGGLAAYGLTPPLHVAPLAAGAGINNQVRVVRTGAGQFLWKHLTHSAPTRIVIEHRLLAWLSGAALPFGTPQPLATVSGETLIPVAAGGWQALFRWLPGEPLARHDPDRSRHWARRSGRCTARWPPCPPPSPPPGRRMGRWRRSTRACPLRPP